LAKKSPPSAEAIAAALHALVPSGEYERLVRFAHWRLLGIKVWVSDTEAQDLANEAIIRTLEGKRIWNPEKHSLFIHLVRCVSSIANERFKQTGKFAELSDVHASKERIQPQLEAKLNMQRLRTRLRGDKIALSVLETMLDDDPPMEARKALKIPPNVYAAARKRIYRQAKRLFGPAEDKAR
jgi:hypothetical protein